MQFQSIDISLEGFFYGKSMDDALAEAWKFDQINISAKVYSISLNEKFVGRVF